MAELTIAYETYGSLAPDRDNAIFICHALTGDAHAAGYHHRSDREKGWWDAMIGPGKGIDARYYFVVCANVLGGCKGTTGPLSIDPATGKPYGASFPRISTRDMVRAHLLLLTHLGIPRVNAVIGGSFGGMQVLEWISAFPDTVERAVCIASGASLSTQALAFDVVGRQAITSDPNWNNGDYLETGSIPEKGLARARQIGHITYLSQEMIGKKFGRGKDENGSVFQVERYLQAKGENFVRRFDANSYLRIMEAMDAFDLAEQYGSLAKAFEKTEAKLLIVALSSDWLFPPERSEELAGCLARCGKKVSYCRLDAAHGHDAFLVDIEKLAAVVRAFLPWVDKTSESGAFPRNGERRYRSPETEQSARIAELVEPGSRVLDLGCGNADLLQLLREKKAATGLGVDIDLDNIITVIDRGLEGFHADIDAGLPMIPDASYQYAILSQTLQAIKRPRMVLREMVRVAETGIVAFTNRGHWKSRLEFLYSGQMPREASSRGRWFDSTEIHPFTLLDFFQLCREENVEVIDLVAIPSGPVDRALTRLRLFNPGASQVLVKVRRRNER